MQIQPPDNVLNASSVKPSHETGEPKAAVSEAVVGELGHAFADAVQKALHSCGQDSAAVHGAKNAIAEGFLETMEAFDAAAETILRFGV